MSGSGVLYAGHDGAFVGCPGDADGYAQVLRRVFEGLPFPGVRPELYYWRESYDPSLTRSASADQFRIARTSEATTDPIFILLAHLIGTPVPPPPEGWGEMRTWLDGNGWGFVALLGEAGFQDPERVPVGKVPMTGTLYELFDALRTGDGSDLRIFDLRGCVSAPDGYDAVALSRQQSWSDRLLTQLGKWHSVNSPRTESDFRLQAKALLQTAFGLGGLDPRVGGDELPGLEALLGDSRLLFGRGELIRSLTHRILGEGASITYVLGVSGTGKSSLLRAGLMGHWYHPGGRLGRGNQMGATSLVVEPQLLQPDDQAEGTENPLVALGRLLTAADQDGTQRDRMDGPYPCAIEGTLSDLPAASGDLSNDLPIALRWWLDLTRSVSGPIVIALDQAEQIDAQARRRSAAESDRTGERVAPRLSAEWQRFTGLMAALSGELDPGLRTAEVEGLVSESIERAPFRLVASLHRRSALELWPLGAADSLAEKITRHVVDVPALQTSADWEAVLVGTCAQYGLTLSDELMRRMRDEATVLAGQAASPDNPEGSATDVWERASVLPQVVTALQLILEHWQRVHGDGDLAPSDMVLDASEYGALARIEGAIERLGESAWSAWQEEVARSSGANMAGFFTRQQVEVEQSRRFGQLLTRLVDTRDGEKQDLSPLRWDNSVVTERADLVSALRSHRLLTSLERGHGQRYLRLPHRSILEYWARARTWLTSVAERLRVKGQLRGFKLAGLGHEAWTDEHLEVFADLALNWIGSGEGDDGELFERLQAGLVERLDVAAVSFDGETRMRRLPYAALFAGELKFAQALVEKCLASEDIQVVAPDLAVVLADRGRSELLGRLLDSPGVDASAIANAVGTNGMVPLLMASQNGHDECVARLVEAGAEVNQVNEATGTFPLLQASQHGHEACVARLVEAGAEVNQVNETNGAFPLLLASQDGHEGCVARLVEAGAKVNRVHETNGTLPLLLASQNGHEGCIARLVEAGAEVNRVNETNGAFPLLLASKNGHEACVVRLLEAGAEVNQADPTGGRFPLLMASQNGHADCVAHLVEAGAEVNRVNPTDGMFPLLQASQNGHDECVVRLIEACAEVNQVNEIDGRFPLLMASYNGHDGVVARLVEAGAEVNRVDENNGTFPLLEASQNGHEECVARLVEAGAEVSRVNETEGTFPLLMASEQGHEGCVARLLEAGAEVNQVNETSGTFPLLQASQNGHDGCVVRLLEAGAEVERVHKTDGTFPLLAASHQGHEGCVALIVKAGAQVNRVHATHGVFPLLSASHKGHDKCVARLVEAGAEVNQVDEKTGVFPLLIASQEGHESCVARLVKAGAEVNQVHEATGVVPLALASQRGHAVCVELLLDAGADLARMSREDRANLGIILIAAPVEGATWTEGPSESPNTQALPLPTIKGLWEAVELDDDLQKQLFGILQHLQMPQEAIRGALGCNVLKSFVGLEADLRAAVLVVDTGEGRILAIELLWLDTRGVFPSVLIGPGVHLNGILVDLAARSTGRGYVDEATAETLASLALLCGSPPGYAVIDTNALKLQNEDVLVRSSYSDEFWQTWRIGVGPEGQYVEVPAIQGDALCKMRVMVPSDGKGIEVLDYKQTIVQKVEHNIPSHPVDQGGQVLPFRILGQASA